MKVFANVVVNNEELLLREVIPYWNTYPVDEWVIYDDKSTDNTVEVLESLLTSKVTILNDNKSGPFNETYSRNRMLEYSRDNAADFVIAIDADELLSANMVEEFDTVLELHKQHDVQYYWYNLVDDVNHIRQDPQYLENYKSFIMPMKHTGSFTEYREVNIHCSRTAPISLPKVSTKHYGLIHLQAINKQFYALKQLWYKHWEYKDLGGTIKGLNMKYDPVVNSLEFNKTEIPPSIIGDINFNSKVYDTLLDIKGYKEYIQNNKVEGLITFGKEYLL
jgi:glycosyltransferase involved in cell wall biosynthesis